MKLYYRKHALQCEHLPSNTSSISPIFKLAAMNILIEGIVETTILKGLLKLQPPNYTKTLQPWRLELQNPATNFYVHNKLNHFITTCNPL